jgi:uncharacterized membrane protein YgcG
MLLHAIAIAIAIAIVPQVVSEHLSSRELAMFYRGCDAFVLPSHGEGWGLPTHEAMAMGLPVVTTDWGGSTEFTKPIRSHSSQSSGSSNSNSNSNSNSSSDGGGGSSDGGDGEPVALLVATPGLVNASGDAWLQGQWAAVDETDLKVGD